MKKPKLIHFDFHGGRGEVARLAFAIGGIEFDDERISFEDWKSRKEKTLFGGLPILEIDGRVLCQSNAINRYVGRLAGLYPDDPWRATLCDEAMDAVEDIGSQIFATFDLGEPQKQQARGQLIAGPIKRHLDALNHRLSGQGGRFLSGEALSVADLKVFVWVRHLRSGSLDHVPADLVDRWAPDLCAHHERVRKVPAVEAHCAATQRP